MATYDRSATEKRLIDAVDAILRDEGVAGLGVNALARRAEANKSLIYRYFDGLDGLLEAYAEAYTLWPPIEEFLGTHPDRLGYMPWRVAIAEVMTNWASALRTRPRTIELLAWECVEDNALLRAFTKVREARNTELLTTLRDLDVTPDFDLAPTLAMLSATLHHLAIHARKDGHTSFGVAVSEDAFWDKLIPAQIFAILQGIAAPKE